MKRICATRAFPLLGLILLVGCSPATPDNGGGNPKGGDNNGGVAVSDSQRLATLDAIQQMIAPVQLNGDPAASDQVANMLSGMTEIADVKVYGGSVVARFTDGELLVVINTRPAELPDASAQRRISRPLLPAPTAIKPSSRTASIIRTPGEGQVTDLPTSKKVLLVNAMGNSYTDDTPTLRDWFAASGYSPSLSDGSVESFRNDVKNIGVLYVSSHAAPMPAAIVPDVLKEVANGLAETPRPTVPLEGSDGKDHFAVWTSTEITNETITRYRGEVKTGRLAYCIADNNRGPDGTVTRGRHFCITEAFILDNWRCQAGAMIYMDCCWSANADIVDVCLHTDVNARTYIGWSAPSFIQYTSPSALYFFDRMLGVNSYRAVSPPQRPFSIRQVAVAMHLQQRLNLPLDQSITEKAIADALKISVSELTFILRAPTYDTALRPAITNVRVNETSHILTLNGLFGSEPGRVMAGGTELPLVGGGWTNESIQCTIPSSGAGSVGDFVVESLERSSNPRRLTAWDLTIRYHFEDYVTLGGLNCPSCFYDATAHYRLRADIAGVRLNTDGDVRSPSYTGDPTTSAISVTDAGGSYTFNQDAQYTATLAPNPDNVATSTGTCIGFSPPNENYVGACFYLNGQDRSLAFSPTFLALGLFQTYSSPSGGSLDGTYPYWISYSGNPVDRTLRMTYSPNYTIESGTQSAGPSSFFEWDSADAQNAPDPAAVH